MDDAQAGALAAPVPNLEPAGPAMGPAGQSNGAAAGPPLHPLGARRVTVRVAAMLRSLARGGSAVQVDLAVERPGGITVGEVLAALEASYPGLHHAALDERRAVRPHVNVFVGGENIRLASGLATPVPGGAEVWILPAVSGG